LGNGFQNTLLSKVESISEGEGIHTLDEDRYIFKGLVFETCFGRNKIIELL